MVCCEDFRVSILKEKEGHDDNQINSQNRDIGPADLL